MGSAYGNTTGSGYWRVYIEWYSWDTGNPNTWGITVNAWRNAVKADSTGYDARNDTTTIYIDGAGASGRPTWNHSSSKGQNRWLWGWSYQVPRTHSGRYAGVSCTNTHPSGHTMSGSSTAYGSEYVPPKPSYTVSYNANGGSNPPSNQTKWYSENLTLSNGSGMTWEHHTLLGWNTEADGSGTHYDLGATYTGNSAITLYAEWTLNAIESQAKIDDSWKSGILYFKVSDKIVIPHTGFIKVNDIWRQIIRKETQ